MKRVKNVYFVSIMKINVKLPRKWPEVTWSQAMQLTEAKDNADLLSVFVNVKAETLRNAQITNLDEVLTALAFTNEELKADIIPGSINGFKIPADLNFKSICRYEDLKTLAKDCIAEEGQKVTVDQLKNYPKMVAVYAMPNYEDATPQEREQFARQFENSPCTEVMAIGNFTLLRLTGLRPSGYGIFQKVIIPMLKLKLVFSVWLRRLVFSVRFYLWKRKHLTSETNS